LDHLHRCIHVASDIKHADAISQRIHRTEVPYAVDGILFTEAASDDPGVSERRIQLIDERDDLRSIGHDQSVTIGDLFNIEFPPILAERPSSAPQC